MCVYMMVLCISFIIVFIVVRVFFGVYRVLVVYFVGWEGGREG